jgi:protein phosphatase
MRQAQAITLDFAAATDVGCRRTNNEDSFGYDADAHIYVVCDGMGGSAAGEVASGLAVRALVEQFGSLVAQELPAEERLLLSIEEANRQVREAARGNPELQTMGTTLVCACLDGERLLIGNVGDSRAYLIRNGRCVQITEDHSFVEEQIRDGYLTREAAAALHLQSVITRAIGAAEGVEADLFAASVMKDDLFLLTSDGLTRYAQPEDIARAAGKTDDLKQICLDLVEFAKAGGGADNVTCLLLRAVEAPFLDETPAI